MDNYHIIRCIEKIVEDNKKSENEKDNEIIKNSTNYKNSLVKTIKDAEIKETTSS